MATTNEIKQWRELVRIHERTIYHLENQITALGPYTPPYVREQHEQSIAERDRYKQLIEQAGATP